MKLVLPRREKSRINAVNSMSIMIDYITLTSSLTSEMVEHSAVMALFYRLNDILAH